MTEVTTNLRKDGSEGARGYPGQSPNTDCTELDLCDGDYGTKEGQRRTEEDRR